MSELAQKWIGLYKNKGAWWTHDGNPRRPHALLRSGKHSNGFCNSDLVIEDAALLHKACSDLTDLYWEEAYEICSYFPKLTLALPHGANRVVGPKFGAIELVHDLAYYISLKQGFPCSSSYAEKRGEGENRTMVFNRRPPKKGERVLLSEDVITTGKSVELLVEPVVSAGAIVLPCIAALVNRSGLPEVNGRKIIALIDHPMRDWDPEVEECPLCSQGSEAISPKDKHNWARLNAKY